MLRRARFGNPRWWGVAALIVLGAGSWGALAYLPRTTALLAIGAGAALGAIVALLYVRSLARRP